MTTTTTRDNNHDNDSEVENNDDNDDDVVNDGEVQYSPVTLHLDLCTILFTLMDHHDVYPTKYNEENEEERMAAMTTNATTMLKMN